MARDVQRRVGDRDHRNRPSRRDDRVNRRHHSRGRHHQHRVLRAAKDHRLHPNSDGSLTTVTITGSGFTGATSVKVKSIDAPFTVDADDQITTSVPATAVTGTITTPDGTATSSPFTRR